MNFTTCFSLLLTITLIISNEIVAEFDEQMVWDLNIEPADENQYDYGRQQQIMDQDAQMFFKQYGDLLNNGFLKHISSSSSSSSSSF